jgi:heat shock protein 90kDa beta
VWFSQNKNSNAHVIMLQPDNPTDLSGKIYDMMSKAMAGKWASQPQPAQPSQQPAAPSSSQPEPLEAEVVEPVEAGQQK